MATLKKQLSEAAFEEHIEKSLVEMHGYVSRPSEAYDRALAMDPELAMRFLESSQGEKVAKLRELHGERMEEKLLARIDEEIRKRGVLDVLRKGVDQASQHFELMYRLPVSGLNPQAEERFGRNIFSVMRQVYFSQESEKSIDLGLFINGLPIATAELKNEMTGQTVDNAKRQYRTDRDSREKLLSFKRCLAHFAADTSEAYMTARLADEHTFFLPFNRGRDGGAGNPDIPGKHKTAYLWEDVWSKESWSDLIQNFLMVVSEDGRETQVFPRFHQRNVVRRLAGDAASAEPGRNYLIQHSAGSGKSMTIAWTAYRLAQLHDADDHQVFDSVFVITDRRDLDKQLRRVIEAFEPVSGFLTSVREDQGAKTPQLTAAIEGGAKVITTTIAVFPYVADVIGSFAGKRFAILVDEAHSSQGGEASRAVHEVLHGDEETDEDFMLKQVKNRQQGRNISYFAFTATPKQETLERFGEKCGDGFAPYDLYSMRQAIEEGFIVDVLRNYTTYKQYFKILKSIPDNPELPRFRALSAIRRYIRNHPETVAQKVEIIVEHFHMTVAPLLAGKAKAMIVTNSRESAVKYKLALDAYLRERQYPYGSLVAFSDEIHLDGTTYTETNMNGIPESQTLTAFKKPENRFLVVANKHQTGFDQPLLCGMYVDKKLSGVNAVQTLSRLNRTTSGKEDVFVLDFANTTEEIKDAFDEYYTTTVLSEGLDENILNDAVREIREIYRISEERLDEFAGYVNTLSEKALHQAINGLLDRVAEDVLRLDDEKLRNFRSKASFYAHMYPYAESVFGYGDTTRETLYWFLKYLLKKLPREGRTPLDIEEYLEAENIKVVRKEKGRMIGLDPSESDIAEPVEVPEPGNEDGTTDPLEEIIKTANEEWGAEFGKEQVKTLERMRDEFVADDDLRNTVETNIDRKPAVSVKFEDVFDKKLNKQFDVDRLLWDTISKNPELKTFVRSKMLDSMFAEIRKGNENHF